MTEEEQNRKLLNEEIDNLGSEILKAYAMYLLNGDAAGCNALIKDIAKQNRGHGHGYKRIEDLKFIEKHKIVTRLLADDGIHGKEALVDLGLNDEFYKKVINTEIKIASTFYSLKRSRNIEIDCLDNKLLQAGAISVFNDGDKSGFEKLKQSKRWAERVDGIKNYDEITAEKNKILTEKDWHFIRFNNVIREFLFPVQGNTADYTVRMEWVLEQIGIDPEEEKKRWGQFSYISCETSKKWRELALNNDINITNMIHDNDIEGLAALETMRIYQHNKNNKNKIIQRKDRSERVVDKKITKIEEITETYMKYSHLLQRSSDIYNMLLDDDIEGLKKIEETRSEIYKRINNDNGRQEDK